MRRREVRATPVTVLFRVPAAYRILVLRGKRRGELAAHFDRKLIGVEAGEQLQRFVGRDVNREPADRRAISISRCQHRRSRTLVR